MLKRLFALCAFSVAATTASAATIQLIANGGFESGTFAGWTVNSTGGFGNDFYIILNGGAAPASGEPTDVNPGGGSFVAVSDESGVGGEELRQGFVVTPGMSSLLLTFDWFNNTHFPYTGPSIDGSDQAARVDILAAGASPFDTGAGVVMSLLLNAGSLTALGTSIPWIPESFDLSGLLAPGAYELRFGSGQCCYYQDMGVDNVSLLANTAAVPEPATLALLGLGLAGAGIARRKFLGSRA